MSCEHIKTDGHEFIVCGLPPAKRCVHCGHAGQFLCDWKVQGRKSRTRTCDRALCASCARDVAPGKHLCREHSLAWDDWQRRHGAEAAALLVRGQPEQMSLL